MKLLTLQAVLPRALHNLVLTAVSPQSISIPKVGVTSLAWLHEAIQWSFRTFLVAIVRLILMKR